MKSHHDINDDEIRIISSKKSVSSYSVSNNSLKSVSRNESKNNKRLLFIGLIAMIILIAIGVVIWILSRENQIGEDELIMEVKENPEQILPTDNREETISDIKPYVEIYDTIVSKTPLTVFVPQGASPSLHIGADVLNDSSAVFVTQAADIRRDNGGIVGAFVMDGELLSRGQSKAGFCAIINGKLIVGVADSTPYLEQAIENDGYFFRQYPLVVGGQVVENKLKPSSLRKALAELNGETVVILTHNKMTLNEFSQVLVDFGVTNAIYLVGSEAFGFARDKEGNRIEFGLERHNPVENINYIVWQ